MLYSLYKNKTKQILPIKIKGHEKIKNRKYWWLADEVGHRQKYVTGQLAAKRLNCSTFVRSQIIIGKENKKEGKSSANFFNCICIIFAAIDKNLYLNCNETPCIFAWIVTTISYTKIACYSMLYLQSKVVHIFLRFSVYFNIKLIK